MGEGWFYNFLIAVKKIFLEMTEQILMCEVRLSYD